MENAFIKLDIQLTEKDYMEFQWSHFSLFRTKKWIPFSLFLVLLFGILYSPYILKVGFSGIDISIFWPLLMFPAGIIIVYLLLQYRTKVAFKTDSFISKPQELIINEEGIYVNAYRSTLNPLWNDIYKYNLTKHGIYIYIADLKAMIIPIRYLDDNNLNTLVELLKNKVNTEKHTTQSKKNVRFRTILYIIVLIAVVFNTFKNYKTDELENKAYDLQVNHNFAEAEGIYTALINTNPEDESNYIERACCKISLNKINSAVLDCETALKLNPNNGRAYYIYAYALINDGRQAEACKAINKSIQLGYATSTEKICGE